MLHHGAMDPHRSERLAQALRESLQEILNFELEDPRLQPVDVAAVELSRDGRNAVVRLEVHSAGRDRDAVIQVIGLARSFIRRRLAESLDLFRVPDLRFEAATQVRSPERMQALLKRIRRGRPRG